MNGLNPFIVRGVSSYRNRGSGDKLSIAGLPLTNNTGTGPGITVCGWAQQASLRAGVFQTLACLMDSLTAATDGMLINYDASGVISGDNFHATTNFGTNYDTTAKFFWAITRNAGSGTWNAYLRRLWDLSLQSVTPTTTGLVAAPVLILGNDDNSDEWTDMRLWNVRIIARPLSVVELIRESSYASPVAVPWAWYPLEGNTTQLLIDWSGNGRHLTRAGSGRAEPFFLPLSVLAPRVRKEVKTAATGHTIAVGQVTETDLAQPITHLKTKALGQVTETDLSQAIRVVKTKTLGQVTETDLAQPISVNPKRRLVGQVLETDLAQAITWAPKRRLVNQVLETDLAQTITRLKSRLIAQVTETDLAQPVKTLKAKLIGQVNETDLAQPITRNGAKVIAITQVAETDLAQSITTAKIRAIGQASETDLAQPITRLKAKTLAQVLELDVAQSITWAPKRRLVGQVFEFDTAQPITAIKGGISIGGSIGLGDGFLGTGILGDQFVGNANVSI